MSPRNTLFSLGAWGMPSCFSQMPQRSHGEYLQEALDAACLLQSPTPRPHVDRLDS